MNLGIGHMHGASWLGVRLIRVEDPQSNSFSATPNSTSGPNELKRAEVLVTLRLAQ